ncbi:MAG: uracil-DNA glycosylase family protein [Pseudomonadota bacterium]
MSFDPQLRQAFRAVAAQTEGIDIEVYQRFGKDPLEPIIGLGDPEARLGFFGRDPGRDEVKYGEPFIGSGGQSVRRVLYEHVQGAPLPDFEASRAVGRGFFWSNTVPYKPVGNQAWSMAVKRRFHPLMRRVLLDSWHGQDLITLGREAFFWFAIDQPRDIGRQLEAFWAQENRFTESIEVPLSTPEGSRRSLRLHPLPHPSPLNQTWLERFPGLLQARLQALG